MGGIGAVIYFIASFPPMYFGESGSRQKDLTASLQTIIVERFGRRKCLIAGSIGMTFCWILLIIFLALGEQRNNKGLLYAGIVMMYLYQVSKTPIPTIVLPILVLTRSRSCLLSAGFRSPGSIPQRSLRSTSVTSAQLRPQKPNGSRPSWSLKSPLSRSPTSDSTITLFSQSYAQHPFPSSTSSTQKRRAGHWRRLTCSLPPVPSMVISRKLVLGGCTIT